MPIVAPGRLPSSLAALGRHAEGDRIPIEHASLLIPSGYEVPASGDVPLFVHFQGGVTIAEENFVRMRRPGVPIKPHKPLKPQGVPSVNQWNKRIAWCQEQHRQYKCREVGDEGGKRDCTGITRCGKFRMYKNLSEFAKCWEVCRCNETVADYRNAYLSGRCDYFLPGSIKSKLGSKGKELNHKIELKNVINRITNCKNHCLNKLK
jgi:hypothetical protein